MRREIGFVWYFFYFLYFFLFQFGAQGAEAVEFLNGAAVEALGLGLVAPAVLPPVSWRRKNVELPQPPGTSHLPCPRVLAGI